MHFFNIRNREAKESHTGVVSSTKLYLNELALLDKTAAPDIVCYCHFNRSINTGQVIAMATNGQLLAYD